MKPALHQDLIAAKFHSFFDFLKDDVCIQNVSLSIINLSVKRTEIADGCTDVGIIDIPVDVVSAVRLWMHTLTYGISSTAEFVEAAFSHQNHAFVERDSTTVNRGTQNFLNCGGQRRTSRALGPMPRP